MSDSQELLSLKETIFWAPIVNDDGVHVVPLYRDHTIADDHVLHHGCYCRPVRIIGIGRVLFSHRHLAT